MASETFDICAGFPVTRLSVRTAASTPDGSPSVRARNKNELNLRVYTLHYDKVPRQLLARVKRLWRDTCFGPSQPMNFTPPDESAIEVRFKMGSFRYQIESATAATFQLELEEVR